MDWQIPTSKSTAASVTILATDQGVFVSQYETIASTADSTIKASGSDNKALIHGTVAGSAAGLAVIAMGDEGAMDSGNIVEVGVSGHVIALNTSVAIAMTGLNSQVVNDGTITSLGSAGILVRDDGTGTTSTIVNTGHIKGVAAIVRYSTNPFAETIEVNNSGVLEGTQASYGIFLGTNASSKDLITNTGKMIGDIFLSDGNDLYAGSKGIVLGEVFGGSGNDVIQGGTEANTFFGDDGLDTLYGNRGADILTGGLGADVFVYTNIKDSRNWAGGRDTITDFSRSEGDLLDLAAIDAVRGQKGNQAFDFIGKHAFSHHAGELRYIKHSGDAWVMGDINGDGRADFKIDVDDMANMRASDFIL